MTPELSIITSFAVTNGTPASGIVSQEGFPFVELYAFMQSHAESLFDGLPNLEGYPNSSVYLMANAYEHTLEEQTAENLHNEYAQSQIVALATFLPEIAAHESNSTAISSAQKALMFLIRTAAILRDKYKHPIKTIELVGGSVVDGLWLGQSSNDDLKVYVLNRLSKTQAIERLLKRLQPVAIEASNKKIALSLELEPGPLFSLGNKADLLWLCNKLDCDPGSPLSRAIGINLDIPHCAFLSDITVAWLQNQPSIYRRIAHAHICDHSRGHFSDTQPTVFHDEEAFQDWLIFLNKLPTLQPGQGLHPTFSGFVSCELESAANLELVRNSMETFKSWMTRSCWG